MFGPCWPGRCRIADFAYDAGDLRHCEERSDVAIF